MESNLSFLPARPVTPPVAEPSAAPASAAVPASQRSDGRDFAEVLNGHTLKTQRQHLAALGTQGQGLQVVPLGSKLNVITSDAPLPDMNSLAQFARAQGLDEAAVQALFGSASLAKSATTQAANAVMDPPASASTGAQNLTTPLELALALANAQAAALSNAAPAAGSGAVAPAAPQAALGALEADALKTSTLETGVPATDAAANPTGADLAALVAQNNATIVMVPVPPPLASALAVPLATPLPQPLGAPALARKDNTAALGAASLVTGNFGAPTTAPTTAAAPAPTATLLAASAAQSPLMPMTAQAWIGSAPLAPIDAAAPPPPLAPQDAVRLTLAMPAPEITKRLAQMSGTGKETTWAALLASGPAAKEASVTTETVTLDLPAGYDLDLLASSTEGSASKASDMSSLGGAGAPLSAASGTASAAGGDSAGNAQAQADHRAQQFQQLADQMGQVAARRLIAQIERGQWKMQMRMQPAALGSINVELDMHAGGLDALFSTDNAVTRELMAQGSSKLRDTLTQSGMTVASVSINGEQGRQSGGNSTPGKGRDAPAGAPAVSSTASARVATSQGGAAAPGDGLADGLNVLA